MSQSSELENALGKSVDITKLIRSVDFPDESVGDAAKGQPRLFLKACRYHVQKMRERQALEAELSVIKATIGAEVRQKIADAGEKTPQWRIEADLLQNKKIQSMEKRFNDAVALEAYAKYVVESYRQRKSSIEAIIDLMGAELYVQRRQGDEGELAKLRKKMIAKYPGRLKPGRDGQDD